MRRRNDEELSAKREQRLC